MNGIKILMEEKFNQKIKFSTIILEQVNENIQMKKRMQGNIDTFLENLQEIKDDEAIILEITLDNGAKIYLDLFDRPSKLDKIQVKTFTELGSSKNVNFDPHASAYVTDSMNPQ